MHIKESASGALSYALQHALQDFEATVHAFEVALRSAPMTATTPARLEKISQMKILLEAMAEIPAILLVKGKTGSAWMDEEIASRMTPEVIEAADACSDIYLASHTDPRMQPLGTICIIALSIISKNEKT